MKLDRITRNIRKAIKNNPDITTENLETHPALVKVFAEAKTTPEEYRKRLDDHARAVFAAMDPVAQQLFRDRAEAMWAKLKPELIAQGATFEQLEEIAAQQLDPITELKYYI